jgi:four helix bundle protein
MKPLPYRDLLVWQRAYQLALAVMDIAERPPLRDRFYFRDQLCRAAMSVPANIAEGNGRSTGADYASYLDRARGSLFELDTWLSAAKDRGYIALLTWEPLEEETRQISAMLSALAASLRRRQSPLPSR